MKAAVRDFSERSRRYRDGFGERRAIVDARGERLEILQLSATLSSAPSFEHAVRERARRVSDLRDDSFSRVRGIETDTLTGTCLVVSDHVPGARLSTVLDAAETRSLPIELAVATSVIRQLLRATVIWREHMPDIVHGAIGPGRIVVTPDGKVVLVEHVFGSALERLGYTRQRYWEELGVALPATFERSIDARADVVQAGAVTLALVLGRRLNASDRLDEIHPAVNDRLTPPLRTWMMRALQLDPAGSFASVLDASAPFDEVAGTADLAEDRYRLSRFVATCLTRGAGRRAAIAREQRDGSAAPATVATDDDPSVADLATRLEALKVFLARLFARAEPATPAVASPTGGTQGSIAIGSLLSEDWTRRAWMAAATALAVGIGLFLLVVGIVPWPREPATGALSIDTRPRGATVTIDGTPRGITPLAIDLAAGDYLVELVTSTERRRVPVTIRAGGDSSHFLEMTGGENAATSELRIRTEPLAASVIVDGRFVGRSPVSVGDLSPGPHTVVLEHEAGSATEQVLIEAGKTSSLFVPLASPAGAGAGWISIANAPVVVQIFENGRLLGSSQIERIMLPAGRHDLSIVNEALGYEERRVVGITAGRTAAVNVSWPTGRLSINAVPWAQAFVDGAPIGETPLANIEVPIGEHEVVFRHPQLGERRASVIVTTRETAKIGIDLRTK